MATNDGGKSRSTICLTGPESSGKSTLARQLASRLGATLVPEAARDYLAGRAVYDAADLLEIARLQVAAEAAACAEGPGLVVCDTDLLVIQIWWEEKYGVLPAELEHALAARSARIYLLARPDLPWQPDPLRENPHDRDRLFERYGAVLDASGFEFGVVSGIGDARLASALREVERLIAIADD